MNRAESDEFFQQLLAEPEVAVEGAPSATARAALLALLTHSRGASSGSDDLTPAKVAAYLSGALDPAEVETFAEELLRAPDEIYELEAAQSFLDRVVEQTSAAPPELVAAVMAEAARELPPPAIPARRSWNFPHWGWQWGLAGGAMAVALFAFIATWISEKPAATSTSVAPPVSAPQSTVELALPQPGTGPRRPAISEPVYTAPNPPQAMTSHAVTVDDYPPDSIRLQEQGAVKLNYFIQTDGNVGDCQLIESSGFPRLDDAACVMVRKWQFKPATVLDGTPVAVWMPVTIVFALK